MTANATATMASLLFIVVVSTPVRLLPRAILKKKIHAYQPALAWNCTERAQPPTAVSVFFWPGGRRSGSVRGALPNVNAGGRGERRSARHVVAPARDLHRAPFDPHGRVVRVLPVGVILVKLTSKGQVTIPQEIRERLGLLPLSEVEFDVVGDSVRIRKARGKQTRGQRIVARLRGSAPSPGLTTDQIMAMTRGKD